MKWKTLCLTAALTAVLAAVPAYALDYTVDAPEDYLFGRPTSVETVTEYGADNVDRSKNTALIPPAFGSPTSYLPNTGEPLTPNLIPGALSGGVVSSVGSVGSVSYPTVDSGSNWSSTAYTPVSSDLYYSNGSLGTLKIPAIGLTVKVYEGTDSNALKKGAGHFSDSSIWNGNVCIAGHNRGVNNHFGQIHTLTVGDTITYTTKLGTRSYTVTLLYLGGNEVSTFKYISELLGKETLDTRTRSVSKGRNGSGSVNYQQTGRELMTPDEVRALDNDRCILFIRGELPVMDRKYDILKHPDLKLTEDGGAAPYIHRPGLTYALEDLPLSTDSWESIEIIE